MSDKYVQIGYWISGYAEGDIDYDGAPQRQIYPERDRDVDLAERSRTVTAARERDITLSGRTRTINPSRIREIDISR